MGVIGVSVHGDWAGFGVGVGDGVGAGVGTASHSAERQSAAPHIEQQQRADCLLMSGKQSCDGVPVAIKPRFETDPFCTTVEDMSSDSSGADGDARS